MLGALLLQAGCPPLAFQWGLSQVQLLDAFLGGPGGCVVSIRILAVPGVAEQGAGQEEEEGREQHRLPGPAGPAAQNSGAVLAP